VLPRSVEIDVTSPNDKRLALGAEAPDDVRRVVDEIAVGDADPLRSAVEPDV